MRDRDQLAEHLLVQHPDRVTPWSAWTEPAWRLIARHQDAHGVTRLRPLPPADSRHP